MDTQSFVGYMYNRIGHECEDTMAKFFASNGFDIFMPNNENQKGYDMIIYDNNNGIGYVAQQKSRMDGTKKKYLTYTQKNNLCRIAKKLNCSPILINYYDSGHTYLAEYINENGKYNPCNDLMF